MDKDENKKDKLEEETSKQEKQETNEKNDFASFEKLPDSEEELQKIIEDLTNELKEKDPNGKAPIIKIVTIGNKLFKNVFLEGLYEAFISILIIFLLNSLFDLIKCNILCLLAFSAIYFIIDYSFNLFIKKWFPLANFITLGLINFLITLFAFVSSGIICIQIIPISFVNFGYLLLGILAYALIKKFVLKYVLKVKLKFKVRKKENK